MKKKIEDIVAAYNSEIRGFYNYYCIANNVAYALSKFDTSWSTVCTIPLQEKPIAL